MTQQFAVIDAKVQERVDSFGAYRDYFQTKTSNQAIRNPTKRWTYIALLKTGNKDLTSVRIKWNGTVQQERVYTLFKPLCFFRVDTLDDYPLQSGTQITHPSNQVGVPLEIHPCDPQENVIVGYNFEDN